MSFSKLTNALSNINFSSIAKKTDLSSLTSVTKKADFGDFATSLKKVDVDTSSFSTAAKKTDDVAGSAGDVASSLKRFETQPGATAVLSKTAAVMAKNPKLTALGITTLSAAGYIAFQMSQGKTFDEAFEDLLSVVEDAVEKTVEVVAGSTADVAVGIIDAFMKGIFGENYLTYVKGSAIVLILMFILGIVLKVYTLVKK